jgi:ribosomal protein S12 methylthiotransferase accessory factor
MKLETTLKKFNSLRDSKYFGNLRASFKFTDEPKFYQFSCISPDLEVESSALDINETKAKIRSLSEYLERFCLNNVSKKVYLERYSDISNNSLDPSRFLNFREEDIGINIKEYSNKIKDVRIHWVRGRDENNLKEIFIPAQQIYVTDFFEEPLIRPRISTGAATHNSYLEAINNGVMENIERDSFMINYLSKEKIPKIKLGGKLKQVENYFNRYLLELNIFETTTDLGIPSFMCLNLDRTSLGPSVSVGLKAGLNPIKAIEGAIMESQQVRQWMRFLYYKDRPKIPLEKKEIIEAKDRGFFWYGVDKIKNLDYLIKNSNSKNMSEIKIPKISKGELVHYLKEKEIDTYSVDISHKKIKESGFHVVKVVQPQLHPLFLDERFPCFYSERLNKILKNKKINSFPHPFI